MRIKKLVDEDFINYRKPSMVLGFPNCSFKCDYDCGRMVCQNSLMANAPVIEIEADKIINRYNDNPMTSAVVLQGLEPLDDMEQLQEFICKFRESTLDDIVVYTGYKVGEEIAKEFESWVRNEKIKNVIIKFGRFIPDGIPIFDEVLGVVLASDNQMAIRIE